MKRKELITMDNLGLFIACIAVPLFIGFLGSLSTTPNITGWYSTLHKPVFSPPNFIFAPVWTALYILMGFSFFLVLNYGQKHKLFKKAIYIYVVQLLFNAIWTPAFFGLKSPLLGLIIIVPMWLAVLANIIVFYKIKRSAGLVLIPYLIWITFATAHNIAILVLN